MCCEQCGAGERYIVRGTCRQCGWVQGAAIEAGAFRFVL